MSEHAHGLAEIMTEETRKELHDAVEQIDRVHAEKEMKRHDHLHIVERFLDALPHYATEFTREVGKPDYSAHYQAPHDPHQKLVRTLIIKRRDVVFLTLILTGVATSVEAKLTITGQKFGENYPKQLPEIKVSDSTAEILSKVIVGLMPEAGANFNNL